MSQRLALLIGNNEYHDPSLAKLVSPPQDVSQLGELLRDPQIGGFDRVDALENQPFSAVRRSIASFFNNNKRDDLLMLYFSGHGVLDDNGQLYLAVQDTERELLSATSIEAPFITSLMDRSISRRQVLVLDCCHSGAFGRSKGGLGASVGTATTFEGKGYGRIILTASDATQYAWDGDDLVGDAQTSVFTRHLVEGLRTGAADTDADGQITLDELYDYVYEMVVTETPRQTPAKWSYRQQGTIVIAHNPSPVIQPVDLPAELRSALESPFTGVRQGAVQDLQRLLTGSDRGTALSAQLALEKLSKDDSRNVSSAALAALASLEPQEEEGHAITAAAVSSVPEIMAPEIMAAEIGAAEIGAPEIEAPETAVPEAAPEATLPTEQVQYAPVITPQAEGSVTAEPERAAVSQTVGSTSRTPDSSVPISTTQPRTRHAPAAADPMPYMLVAAGISLGQVAALLFALILNNMIGYFIGLALAGFVSGYLLFRTIPRYRWAASAILAVIWSIPFYLSLFTLTAIFILAAEYLYYCITGLAILLRSQLLLNKRLVLRSLLDMRRVGLALLAGIAGVIGTYLGAVPFANEWETFVSAAVEPYLPSDVISWMNPAGYFSIALAAILGGGVFCLVLYLLERYRPIPAAGLPGSSQRSAPGEVRPKIATSPPPVDVPAATYQQSRSTAPPRSARGNISTLLANPYITVSILYITGWLFALFLAQITNAFFSLLIGWALVGFATGQILARDKPQHKWVLSILLAVAWSLPAYLSLYSEYWLMMLASVSFAGLVNGLAIILVSRPAR